MKHRQKKSGRYVRNAKCTALAANLSCSLESLCAVAHRSAAMVAPSLATRFKSSQMGVVACKNPGPDQLCDMIVRLCNDSASELFLEGEEPEQEPEPKLGQFLEEDEPEPKLDHSLEEDEPELYRVECVVN